MIMNLDRHAASSRLEEYLQRHKTYYPSDRAAQAVSRDVLAASPWICYVGGRHENTLWLGAYGWLWMKWGQLAGGMGWVRREPNCPTAGGWGWLWGVPCTPQATELIRALVAVRGMPQHVRPGEEWERANHAAILAWLAAGTAVP